MSWVGPGSVESILLDLGLATGSAIFLTRAGSILSRHLPYDRTATARMGTVLAALFYFALALLLLLAMLVVPS